MFHFHEHVLERLNAYLDRTLARVDATAVKEHCARCPSCRAALDRITAARWTDPWNDERAGSFPGVGPQPAQGFSRRPRAGRQIFVFFGLTLAVAGVILAGFHVHFATLKPSPYDLRVLGQTEWLPDTDAALHLRLLGQDGGGDNGSAGGSGRPLRGVPISIELSGPAPGQKLRLASVTTSEHGAAAPRVHLPDWPDGEYTLRVTANTGRTPEVLTRTVALKRSWRLMVSTDKPVYQPGQVIRARGLALRRPDLKPVAGQEMVFSVTDPRGNVIFRDRGATSRFGIGSADCALAGELIEGNYQVECCVGATTGRATVEVKSYVLPRFKVTLALDQPSYQPGQLLKGLVRADYVFGKPVTGGIVTIALESTDVAPTKLHTMELHTDAGGAAAFELRLPEALLGREQDSGSARIAVTATVRDPAGQTQERTETRVVAAQPIRIEVIPEAGTLVKDLPNTIYLLTSTHDGQPVRTRVKVSGLHSGPPAAALLQTSELGLASFEVTPRADTVSWAIEAQDDHGRTSRRQMSLTCGQIPGDYLVRTDKAVYHGGQSIHILAMAGGVEPIVLDLIKDGQTVRSETIEISGGRGERELSLPAELIGTVVLRTYRYGPDGLPVHKSRVIQIQPVRGLTITTAIDRSEYRPGQRAALFLSLTDDQGKPVPGAISLAAVDEAVFGVLDRRPGLERTFFTLEQQLLEPVYQIKEWTPDALDLGFPQAPPADRERFEQALFARTARGQDQQIQAFRTALGDDSELSDRSLRVLEQPDWEQIAKSVGMPGELVAQLHEIIFPYSLDASSYAEELRTVESIRLTALDTIGVAWFFVVLTGLAGGLLWAIRSLKTWIELLVIVSIACVLAGLLLPAVQSAREASRRAQATNDLKQIGMAAEAPQPAPGRGAGAEAVRVRRYFPETLLWRPELITDDQGKAALEFDLADSITTWRVSAGAVAADGRLGAAHAAIRVFQPFFVDLDLPVALLRGDEVALPVIVSSYLDKPQTVALSLEDAPWFERLESAERSVTLEPNEVRAARFRIRVKMVGRHELQVTARGSDRGVADTVRRPIDVVPDGRRVEQVAGGTLPRQHPVELALTTPDHAIPGSVTAIVKIYPSSFSQVVEGLDSIFQRPYGCFEQTSSVTYPNVLALDYLRRTDKSAPAVEAKARQFIHLGYQRLVSFEVSGGGFDWFGSPPANRTLTAYGLMEFHDMARVHDVDPALIARTRSWLLDQQRPDGSWDPEGHSFHGNPADRSRGEALARLSTTAYVAWSAFSGPAGEPEKARAALAYLQDHAEEARDQPYALALVANAFLAIDAQGTAARSTLDRLGSLARSSTDGKLVWWEPALDSESRHTLFFGGGDSRLVETTALAALAFLKAGRGPETARGALAWLVAHKDGSGTWNSTQATVLALKALVAGTGKPLDSETPRRIVITLDGAVVRELLIAANEADVMRQVDLSDQLARGTHHLSLDGRAGRDSAYQVVFRYHEPDAAGRPAEASSSSAGALTIRVDYNRTSLAVDETVTATATVVNNRGEPAPMVILDIPIPAGFSLDVDDLAGMVKTGAAAKFQLTPRNAIIYLRDLGPRAPLTLRYRLRARMPVKLTVPPARAYEYYDPARQGSSPAARLAVTARSAS